MSENRITRHMKIDKKYIKRIIKSKGSQIKELGVSQIGLFGSYVRQEQKPESDIDIYIVFNPQMERFDNLMKLYDLLEDTFKGTKVEIVTQNGLSPYIGPKILKEVEYVEIDE